MVFKKEVSYPQGKAAKPSLCRVQMTRLQTAQHSPPNTISTAVKMPAQTSCWLSSTVISAKLKRHRLTRT